MKRCSMFCGLGRTVTIVWRTVLSISAWRNAYLRNHKGEVVWSVICHFQKNNNVWSETPVLIPPKELKSPRCVWLGTFLGFITSCSSWIRMIKQCDSFAPVFQLQVVRVLPRTSVRVGATRHSPRQSCVRNQKPAVPLPLLLAQLQVSFSAFYSFWWLAVDVAMS